MSNNMLNILGNLDSIDTKPNTTSVRVNEGIQVGGNELAILNKMNESVAMDNVTIVGDIKNPQNDTSIDESDVEEQDEVEGVVFHCNNCGVNYMAMTTKCPHCQSYDTDVYGDAVASDYDDDEYEVEEIDIAFPDSTGHFSITNEGKSLSKSTLSKIKNKEEAMRTVAVLLNQATPEATSAVIDIASEFKLSGDDLKKAYKTMQESVEYDDDDDCYVEDEDRIEDLNEATKTVVHGGKLQKIKVRTKKKKMTSAQKKALAKARKKAHTASANKARNKSMKVRRKKLGEGKTIKINESASAVNKSGLAVLSNDSTKLVEYAVNLGFQFNRSEGNFVKRMNECTLVLDNLSGDATGVGLYGLNTEGNYINESKLTRFVNELGLNL